MSRDSTSRMQNLTELESTIRYNGPDEGIVEVPAAEASGNGGRGVRIGFLGMDWR